MSITEATSGTHLQFRRDCSHFKNARDISIPASCLVREVSVFKSRKKERKKEIAFCQLNFSPPSFSLDISSLCYLPLEPSLIEPLEVIFLC